ncbi:DNA mismatch repair endonuclease MutL [Simkania negevensis]|uniref:DNA mismatch repair protein MutL n=1 Tax=Simkania negevensis (strain ATCC VR-1471 / DSM 27360 / Z) TaxID=331113 RepID=F8L5Q5_SIMNZ|nr:DNA mismatch repair endonuclease MutL [Simkania negevensis]CCB88047.1 DNA mismatch repair protein mutL [Simkania negevensis Z]
MANTIHVLSEETINLIAAGEVIENPASVVKELLENAVDAEATRVTVEIQGGGFKLLSVSDNGKGMSRDDLLLCIERHATSKIRIADDLTSIFSMGFRGEALASIAAISKMRITSCRKDDANKLYAEGGKIQSLEPATRNPGTTVAVHALFYNVPARRKFQKSAQSCQNSIVKMLTKLALAHPFLEVKCIADGKEVFSSFMKRSKEKEVVTHDVIEKVLGAEFLEGTSEVHHQEHGCFLHGFIGSPHGCRKSKAGQYLFVNGRAIQSAEISRAIYEGYGTRLPLNEHPTFVLHLTLPSQWIDVNVHPQKTEIRLHESSEIEHVVRKGVFEALQRELSSNPTNHPKFETSFAWEGPLETTLMFREEKEEMLPPQLPTQHLPIIGLYSHYLLLDAAGIDLSIGGSDGIILVDLQAAKAQITFESILNRFEQTGEMQTLLFPITFECAIHEKGLIESHLPILQKLGIAIRLFGENTFVVDALDPHLEEMEIKKLVDELVEILHQFGDDEHLAKKQQKKLALTILRYARSEREGVTLEQARAIAKQLFSLPSPFYGPTGKPTCIYMSQDEIENHFR